MFNIGDTVDGHMICLKALVGSHNYNLDTPASDKDYKYFVYPTYWDLYNNKTFHKEVVSDIEDYAVYDIRQLPNLLWKSNLNFIEILYSKEIAAIDENDEESYFVVNNKEKFATMNLPKLYWCAWGMFHTKRKDMLKDSPGRHDSIRELGYDAKSAYHAYRVLDFLSRYEKKRDIEKALWYEEGDPNHKLLLDIKNGKYSLHEINDILKKKITEAERLKEFYEEQPLKEDMLDILEGIVYYRVGMYIGKELLSS